MYMSMCVSLGMCIDTCVCMHMRSMRMDGGDASCGVQELLESPHEPHVGRGNLGRGNTG